MSGQAYFSDRCGASVEVKPNAFAPCGLKIGHEGPHEPVQPGTQTASVGPRSTPPDGCYLDCWEYPACPCGVRDEARETEEERARWAELQARAEQ